MSWLQKLLPPKIQRTGSGARKTVPEGLWTKCASCDAVLYSTDLEKNLNVCPKCGFHQRIGARARLDALLDADGRFEIGAEVLPVDSLKFKDSKKYTERLVEAEAQSAESEALIGFAGPRVIEQTIKQKLPKDFQRSEFLKQQDRKSVV